MHRNTDSRLYGSLALTVLGILAVLTGPLWFGPADRETSTVSFVGQGQNGQQVVTIENQAQGFVIRRTYEVQPGTLVAYENFAQSTGSTLTFQLADRR